MGVPKTYRALYEENLWDDSWNSLGSVLFATLLTTPALRGARYQLEGGEVTGTDSESLVGSYLTLVSFPQPQVTGNRYPVNIRLLDSLYPATYFADGVSALTFEAGSSNTRLCSRCHAESTTWRRNPEPGMMSLSLTIAGSIEGEAWLPRGQSKDTESSARR